MAVKAERIPDSVKGPLSLAADYADPRWYGWPAIIVGMFAVAIGVVLIPSISSVSGLGFLVLGVPLVAAGYWMVTRAR